MYQRLTIFAALLAVLIAACQPGLPPTQIVIEVTKEIPVTVVVTPNTNTTGPLPLEEDSPTPAAANAAAATEAVDIAESTPAVTPTPDAFPEPEVGQVFVAEQRFQNGRMFWVRPIEQIWVLTSNEDEEPVWEVYEDQFEDGMPELDPGLVPPASGLEQPIRGFGLLWRENDSVRNRLGWAIAPEVGYFANYEYHYGGTVNENNEFIQGPGFHLIENPQQQVFQFNEGVWDWEVREP